MKSSIAVVDIDVRIAIRELYDEMLVCFTVELICFKFKVSWHFDLCWFRLEFMNLRSRCAAKQDRSGR